MFHVRNLNYKFKINQKKMSSIQYLYRDTLTSSSNQTKKPKTHYYLCSYSLYNSIKQHVSLNDKTMSCSQYHYSDFLCCTESPEILSEDPHYPAQPDIADSIDGLINDEKKFVPGYDYVARFRSLSLDAKAREESVAWILKVKAFYNFQPLTAYLAVNYLDRFLYSSQLPETNGWPMQLLSVACLSLAAKMDEPLVPSLLDLQVEGAKFIFEPRTICRMELLVLDILDWRLRSVTPFSFIHFFASKLEYADGDDSEFLISKATRIILFALQDVEFYEYSPSCIGAASILCAAREIPDFHCTNPEHAVSWCEELNKEKVVSCYRLMQVLLLENSQSNSPRVKSQFRVTAQAIVRSDHSCLSSSSSATSFKRRKLNNCIQIDDDKGYSLSNSGECEQIQGQKKKKS